MVFTGTYEHSIDAKNRLAIPAEMRVLVQEKPSKGKVEPVSLYVTPAEDRALFIYTVAGFEQRSAELINSDADADQLLVYERVFFSQARRIEMDSAGRIRLPENLLRRAQMGSQVVLLGVNDHIEVRDRQTWYEYVDEVLRQQPQLLMNPRRAVRPTRG